jgi:hypothetical protein
MVDMFVHQNTPLLPGQWPEQRVRRPNTPSWSGAQALEQFFERRLRRSGVSRLGDEQ